MLLVLLQFMVLAAVIVVAGTFLSRNADEIAEITGFGRIVVGSVLLAGATSLPELSVDIACVRQGNPDLAVGDLLGSSLMNLLILAVLDLAHATRGRMFSRPAAAHALGGAASIVVTSIVAIALFSGRQLGGKEWLGFGAGSWVVLIAYAMCIRTLFLDQRIAARATIDRTEDVSAPSSRSAGRPWKPFLIFAVAAIAILITGPSLSATADELAELSGLTKSFVGTSLIALSTSLPELVACWVAVRIGAFDLAIGNVLGSNAFNMTILAILDLFQPGALMAVVSLTHVVTANAIVLATSVTIMGQLYHVERRTWGIEPDAVLVILIVVVSLSLVYILPV